MKPEVVVKNFPGLNVFNTMQLDARSQREKCMDPSLRAIDRARETTVQALAQDDKREGALA